MTECIYFEGAFQLDSPKEHTITTPSGKEWHVEDLWFIENDEVFNKLSISNEYVESYYYADLEVSYGENSFNKIRRSVRMLSSNIWFKISKCEYADELGSNSINTSNDQRELSVTYNYKLTLAPVIQFNNVKIPPGKLKKMKKRTKIDMLKGLKELSNDMTKLHEAKDYSDVILRCGETEVIKAHKNILSARSELFNRLFHEINEDPKKLEYEFKGLNVRIVNANNCDDSTITLKLTNTKFETFKTLVLFIYKGQHQFQNFNEAKALFEMAHVFGVDDLKEKCLLKLKSEVSSNAQFELYHFALKHHCEMLKREVMDRVSSDIIHRRMKEEWMVNKWMTIFERYQKPFYQKVTKQMNQHIPIGVYDPSDNFSSQSNWNEVSNVVTQNSNEVSGFNGNEVGNVDVESNNEVGGSNGEEIGNVAAENNNEVDGSNENDVANGCEQHSNSTHTASVDYYENFYAFKGGDTFKDFLYATVYFDTRKNPENFDNNSVTSDNDMTTKDTGNNRTNIDDMKANGSNSNEIVNGDGLSNKTSNVTHNKEIRGKNEKESGSFVSDTSSTNNVSSVTSDVSSVTGVVSSVTGGVSSITGGVSSVPSSVASITSTVASVTSNVTSVTINATSVTSTVASVTSSVAGSSSSESSDTSKEIIYDDSVFNDDPQIRRILDDIMLIINGTAIP